jgi:hypothetical protein
MNVYTVMACCKVLNLPGGITANCKNFSQGSLPSRLIAKTWGLFNAKQKPVKSFSCDVQFHNHKKSYVFI